jgi:hypothetical protein
MLEFPLSAEKQSPYDAPRTRMIPQERAMNSRRLAALAVHVLSALNTFAADVAGNRMSVLHYRRA